MRVHIHTEQERDNIYIMHMHTHTHAHLILEVGGASKLRLYLLFLSPFPSFRFCCLSSTSDTVLTLF